MTEESNQLKFLFRYKVKEQKIEQEDSTKIDVK